MKCPYCGEEMIRGYLMSSRDITFAVDNVTKVFRIKQSDDLELSKGSGGIPHCEAYRCSSCKKILIDYANRQIQVEQNRCAMACQGCGAAFFFSIIK